MTVLGALAATTGSLLTLLAGIGLLRLRDPLSRLHAVAKAATLGVGFTLLGTVLLRPSVGVVVKAALTLGFLLFVTPISGHLVARAAYRAGLSSPLEADALADRRRDPTPDDDPDGPT